MLYVSGDFFNALGVRPTSGRLFTGEDDQRGCNAPGIVISHQFWQREFGGDANVIGRKFAFADRSFEIIGVTPADFYGMEVGRSFDLSLPVCAVPLIRGNNSYLSGTIWWLTVNGRLKPGWTVDQATAHVQSISPDLFQACTACELSRGERKGLSRDRSSQRFPPAEASLNCARSTNSRSGYCWRLPG